KSVAEGIPSTLAAPEVVVAVAAYWAIAIYFETTTRLWVSICVAPLLLLRCEQSVALGAWWVDLMMRVRNVLSTASDYPAPARIRLGSTDLVIEGAGLSAKLQNATPGGLVIVVGVILIAISLRSSVKRTQRTPGIVPTEILDDWLLNSFRVTDETRYDDLH